MPGLCPYLLSSLKDPSGPGRGGPWLREQSLAGGVGVGGGGGRISSTELLPPATPKASRGGAGSPAAPY